MTHALISFFAAAALLVVAYYVLTVIGRWKLFQKMGEPGWKSIIPFYNTYIIYKHCWNVNWFIAVLALLLVDYFITGEQGAAATIAYLASIAAMLISASSNYYLSRSFGHGALFAVGLYCLNPIFTIILGFGESIYLGNASTAFTTR